MIGLYHSATSVANDSQLRREIKQSIVKETKLLQSIGEAEMEQQIERKVIGLANDQTEMLTKQTGIEPSLSLDEAKQYLHEILKEIKAQKQ